MIIIYNFFIFRKNASIVDEANNTKWDANKILTSNSSQSKADDPIDGHKKVADREKVDEDKDFCRTIEADDNKNDKMSPNKDSSRFINDEPDQRTIAPSIDHSTGIMHPRKSLKQESLDVIDDNTSSNKSRSSSPIADLSIPKDLSVASKTHTRSPCVSPERSCISPMDSSPSLHKDSPIKSFNNLSTCKYNALYLY